MLLARGCGMLARPAVKEEEEEEEEEEEACMCRFAAYLGEPVLIEDLLYGSDGALVRQVVDPELMSLLNLGGFGWLEAPEYSMLVFTPAEDGKLAVDTRELAS